MATSTLKIKFTQDFGAGIQLSFIGDYSFYGDPRTTFTWTNLRTGSYQVPVGLPTSILGERSAINFMTSFLLDLPSFQISRDVNEITITSNFGSQFDVIGGLFYPVTNDPSLIFTINNASLIPFSINQINFSEPIVNTKCTHVKVTIETNNLATKILSPVIVNPNTQNPFSFEVLRGIDFNLELEDASTTSLLEIITVPDILNSANFNVQVNNSPNGATITIENTNSTLLSLEYSLDNITFQTSNIYIGLLVGNYTLYVRDQLGCSFNKVFNISEFGIYTPNFYISKSNSFRFANRITFGDSENYKNDENTLSCEVDVQKAYKEIQQFQSADIITTQFRSNYALNTAKIIKQDLTQVTIPITKKTSNIGIKDKRDARKYDLGLGKNGVYFISGNIYDYTTNAIIEAYALNGSIPEWAETGNYIQIGLAWFLIEEIIFDENINAYVIVFSDNYTGPEINIVAGSIYNRENYEVYEFFIDMVDYIDEKFRVQIENIDPNFTTIKHLSELIWCKVKHEKVLEIKYKNTTNTDIMYSTGIEHLIRIPYFKISGKPDESSEIHKTDTDAILLNADLYEVDEIQFQPVTKEIWRKIIIALSHEKVTLDGVGYVKNGNFNTEGALDKSNLYVLTANMIKTGSVYNSQTSGNIGFDGTAVEVPGLISTESGYMSY